MLQPLLNCLDKLLYRLLFDLVLDEQFEGLLLGREQINCLEVVIFFLL